MNHELYKTGDAGAPAAILDRNGEVTLSLCKVCGGAEGAMPTKCPEEMTPEQMAEYERHQVSVPDHGFTPMRKHLDWVIKKKKKA